MASLKGLANLYSTAQRIVAREVHNRETSPEEISRRVEGLVNIYKHNYEAFVQDYKKTNFCMTVVSIPFTDEELVTIKALRYIVTLMLDTSTITVNGIHQKLSEVLNNYNYSRKRTYRILERGYKSGLFNKHKVQRSVAYRLTSEAWETKLQLLREAVNDYVAATRLMNLGTVKATELDEDWQFEMIVEAAEKTVNFYLLGHY